MPTRPAGWSVLRWDTDSENPVQLYLGDQFIAERIFTRESTKLLDGRLELLDTRNEVRQHKGYHQLRQDQTRGRSKSKV